MNEHPSEEPASPDRTRTLMIVAGVATVLVIVLLALLLIDPFGWNVFGLKRAETAAQAIPTDVAIYLSLDLGNITCEDLNPIVWAFSGEFKEEGKCAIDELFSSLDEDIPESWGLTFTDDVKPWIGESIAMGLGDLDLDAYGGLNDAEIMFAIEVSDPAAADEFLHKMMGAMAEETGERFLEETYLDATLYYVDAQKAPEQYTFSRSGDLLIFGMGKSDVMAAIDAQQNESLADSSAFQDTIAELPSGRMLTIYMDSGGIFDMLSSLFESVGEAETLETLGASFGPTHYEAAGVYIVDAGIRVDLAFVLDPDDVDEETLTAYQDAGKRPQTETLMPEGSLVYHVGAGINQAMENLQANLVSMEGAEDITEALMLFEMTFGFDPFVDFFGKFDGEWAFGIVPSEEGILAEGLGVPLDFVFLAETSDPEGLQDVAARLGFLIEMFEIGMVETLEFEKTTLYELIDMTIGESLLTYGMGEGYFVLGSSTSSLNELFAGGPSLADSERYNQVWKEFPKDMSPVTFVDIRGLTAAIEGSIPSTIQESFEQEGELYTNPITYFAIAGTQMEDGVARATMILFIEKE
jgi:hypothetical protein